MERKPNDWRQRGCRRLSWLWCDQRQRIFTGSWRELYLTPPFPPSCPHLKTSSCPNCHCLPATPSGVWKGGIKSLCSCGRRRGAHTRSFCSYSNEIAIGTRSPLSSCTRSSRGGYPHPHDTPSPPTGGHQEGLQVSCGRLQWGAINHMCHNLCACAQRPFRGGAGVSLLQQDFFNPDTLRHHKKSY